jgi:hypothetical protein
LFGYRFDRNIEQIHRHRRTLPRMTFYPVTPDGPRVQCMS